MSEWNGCLACGTPLHTALRMDRLIYIEGSGTCSEYPPSARGWIVTPWSDQLKINDRLATELWADAARAELEYARRLRARADELERRYGAKELAL